MPLSQETQKNDSTCPYVNCTPLVRMIEESLRRHVTFSARSIFDFHLLLKVHYFLDSLVFDKFFWLSIRVNFNLRQAKINQ